ncbi:MAG: hypothetical protein J1E39_08250 [Eubacterium sp.]|nr:hypothetical protein [Eubacterium sp.]
MDITKVPNWLKYTAGEKIAEILTIVLTVVSFAGGITLFASGITNFSTVITGICIVLVNGAFTFASVFPQWTNIMDNPEKCTDENFHRIRKQCLAGKFILTAAMYVIIVLAILI